MKYREIKNNRGLVRVNTSFGYVFQKPLRENVSQRLNQKKTITVKSASNVCDSRFCISDEMIELYQVANK